MAMRSGWSGWGGGWRWRANLGDDGGEGGEREREQRETRKIREGKMLAVIVAVANQAMLCAALLPCRVLLPLTLSLGAVSRMRRWFVSEIPPRRATTATRHKRHVTVPCTDCDVITRNHGTDGRHRLTPAYPAPKSYHG